MGRKSNAVLAKEAAAKAAEQVVETVEVTESVSSPVDPETEMAAVLATESVEVPVSASVDPVGEDLGDVTQESVETPVIEAGELVETFSTEVQGTVGTEVTELPEITFDEYELEEGFAPILRPTMVGEATIGHIPCPKAVFDLVQVEGWQDLIDDQPAHVKAGLKSVLHWKNINGTAKVRCQSSSKFAEVV